ncbi:MAG: sulfatase-like hydrolase/transferase, partial [Planctomycetes bacterium]|nr:sulfatase-like hydrolase/transferase [Planctomycetota bacterium]
VGFYKPHLPFVAPRKDWEALAGVEVPLPPPGKIESPYWHSSSEFYQYRLPFPAERPLPVESTMQARRAYLACVRYVDRQIGKLLRELESLKLADRTVVIVWGDHGWHLGEQQIWGKHSPFERALRSVLMIRAPGLVRPGRSCDALVETIDLYPTLVDLCRPRFTRTEHPLDGKSLVPILRGTQESVREAAASYWKDAVSIRGATHRLVARIRDGRPDHVELYDLSEGPDSTVDLSGEEPELVRKLSAHLPAGPRL